MVKFSAVFSTSGLNIGQSFASRPSMTTAVTTFVFTPQMARGFSPNPYRTFRDSVFLVIPCCTKPAGAEPGGIGSERRFHCLQRLADCSWTIQAVQDGRHGFVLQKFLIFVLGTVLTR